VDGTLLASIAIVLQYRKHPLNRRTRQRLYLAAGILSLAVWMFMAAAETWTPLHAWLHGGTIPDNDDDCAIVAIAHGKVETVAACVAIATPAVWIETSPRIKFSVLSTAIAFLPNGRAPPVFAAIS
jgi:hypothetical protein